MRRDAMAEEEEEVVDYESDPEEAKLSLKMRRREASDDEEEERESRREKPLRMMDDSDGEFEGAAAEYEDELEEEDYDLDEGYVEEEIAGVVYEESGNARGGDGVVVGAEAVARAEIGKGATDEDTVKEKVVKNEVGEVNGDSNVDGVEHEEEKKEVEPFAVPTAGAFYMHDDRFRDNVGGRHRRMLGGRKLWESKDDRKWGHDKYEELTLQERNYEECRRGSRGRYRGRGRNRGTDRGYARGYRPREYTNNSSQDNNNPSNAPKGVRGRGPRRYQPSLKNNEAPLTQNKQSGKLAEKLSSVGSVRTSESASHAEPGVVPPRKQVFASNLSIASPPFYPSGSSTKDNNVPHKRDAQAGTINCNGQPSVADENFNGSQSSAMLKGKNIVDSIGVDKLSIDGSVSAIARKPLNSMHVPASSSPSINSTTQSQFRGHGRGITSLTQMAYQPAGSNNPVNRVSLPSQLHGVPRNPGQTRAQSSVQASGQQFTRLPSVSQAPLPPNATTVVNAYESGELESPSESSKSKTALVAKGKGNVQGSGRGSFLYGGAHVMGASGNMGTVHGDQNFPTFLPVMQFGGQHPRGMGVPAVGMAFPGYVGQPQLGLGNSEMTWLPVLAGAAGALGASYCPPYISVDGSFHARPSGQTTAITAASSKENSSTKDDNDWKPEQRPELTNDDSGQRQKNPRRYTEMKFDQ